MSTVLTSTAHATPMALRCPKCAADMVTYERSGIVLDQCRECRGIFLDRGELERVVDAESGGTGWAGPQMQAPAPIPLPRMGDLRPVPGNTRTMSDPGPIYHSEWRGYGDDDDDDRPYRRDDGGWDERRRRDGRGKPQKRRSLLGELLEGLGD